MEEILKELRLGGWEIKIEADKVIVRGKPLSDELRKKIKRNKDLILNYHRNKKILEIVEKFKKSFEDGIEVLPPDKEPKSCYACSGTLFWISKYNGHLYCAICHPPADQSIVAGWREYKKGVNK